MGYLEAGVPRSRFYGDICQTADVYFQRFARFQQLNYALLGPRNLKMEGFYFKGWIKNQVVTRLSSEILIKILLRT